MVERIGWCCATSGVLLTVCLKERVFREVQGLTFIFVFSNQLRLSGLHLILLELSMSRRIFMGKWACTYCFFRHDRSHFKYPVAIALLSSSSASFFNPTSFLPRRSIKTG